MSMFIGYSFSESDGGVLKAAPADEPDGDLKFNFGDALLPVMVTLNTSVPPLSNLNILPSPV